MSVERDDVFKQSYPCNDSQTVFPITFETSLDSSGNAEHIRVIRYYVEGENTYSDILEETTEYTISGMNIETVLTYDSNTTLIIVRNVDLKQLVSFLALGSVDLRVLEGALDKLHYIAQQGKETTSRAIVADIADEVVDLTLPLKEVRAGKVAAWNSEGEWLAAEGASSAPVSPFMATVTEQVDADDALTTLVRDDLGEASKATVLDNLTDSLTEPTKANVRANLDVYSDAEADTEIYSVVDYTIIAVDTTLTKRGHYRVTAFCEITLPVSLTVGEAITIKAEAPCNVLQPNAENIVVYERYGKQTAKGTGGILRLKYGQTITLTYDGEGYYYTSPSLIDSLPGVVYGYEAEWSPCGTYLAVATSASPPYLQWYKRSGDTLTLLTSPIGLVTGVLGVAWSPCGTYLAVGTGTTSPYVQWFKRSGDTMTLIGGLTGAVRGHCLSWSPCGTYLAVGCSGTSPYVQWFKRSGDTMTLIGGLTGAVADGSYLEWSPCGTYLAVATTGSTPFAQWYRRSEDTMTLIGGITGVPRGQALAWSPCGTYLAVSTGTISPYVCLYKRTGDTLIYIGALPGVAGASSGASRMGWSPCGTYLTVCVGTTSPYVQLFKRSGDTMTLIGGLTGITARGQFTKWSPCGTYLAVGSHSVSPYMQWYKTKALADYRYSVKELENTYEFELEPMFYLLPPG